MNARIMSRTALTVSVAFCSSSLGYLIGRNDKERNVLKDPHPAWKSLLFSRAYAKSNVFNSNRNSVVPRRVEGLIPKLANDGEDTEDNNNEVALIKRYGYPSMVDLKSFNDFVLSYDKRCRNAHWVLEHLTPEKIKCCGIKRENMTFEEDKSIHRFYRATVNDYRNSGYDKGHLAACANHKHSQTAMAETFTLSNISPQVGEGFNRNGWNELEIYTRKIVQRSRNVYVLTGPLYLPCVEEDNKMYVKYEVIGRNHVAVPTHFFKVLLIENKNGELELQSFVLPNKVLPKNFRVEHWFKSIESIERSTGLNIFDNIPRDRLTKINNKPT